MFHRWQSTNPSSTKLLLPSSEKKIFILLVFNIAFLVIENK